VPTVAELFAAEPWLELQRMHVANWKKCARAMTGAALHDLDATLRRAALVVILQDWTLYRVVDAAWASR